MATKRLKLTLLLSSVLLSIGLLGPVMTIQPAFGEFNVFVKAFAPDKLSPQTFSILGGIGKMFSEGDFFIGLVILSFSVIFPICKLCVYWSALNKIEKSEPYIKEFDLIDRFGKLSMLDIFVLAVLVVAIKGLPGGSKVIIEWGAAAFTASILLTLYFSSKIRTLSSGHLA
jgi:paraquat-inducible protein A